MQTRPSSPTDIGSPALSVIIPAYNEEQSIGLVLSQIREVMRGSGLAYELIVVDDGSEDRTRAIAKEVRDVSVLSHRKNRGYGAALKTGIQHAASELVCITDADGTYPISCIPRLVEHLVGGEWDMVVGARSPEAESLSVRRRIARWVLRRAATFVAGEVVVDPNSGLRVFRKDVVLRFFSILAERFSFTTTITLTILANGYVAANLPIEYHPRLGRSKFPLTRDAFNIAALLLPMSIYFAPLKVSLPLSAYCFC